MERLPRPRLNRLLVLALLVMAGCSPGVHLRRITDSVWFQREGRNALDSLDPSERTMQFLRREGRVDDLYRDREALLHDLHNMLVTVREREVALHLAELCYLHATQGGGDAAARERLFLSSCQYAYTFLFDAALGELPSGYDPAFRWACDFYNRSLAKALGIQRERYLAQTVEERRQNTTHELLTDQILMKWGLSEHQFDPTEYQDVLIAFEYDVVGLPGKARSYGLGVPLILVKAGFQEGMLIRPLSVMEADEAEHSPDEDVDVQQSFPATAILRLPESILDAAPGGTRDAWFELYDPSRTSVIEIADQRVPLEQELSTALAHTLESVPMDSGMFTFLRSDRTVSGTNLSMLQPYDPDKIPVVFVHGLMSSPMTWVRLFNDLLADRQLRERYQFWFFRYSTGFPVEYSASLLRETLLQVRESYDPEGTSRAFRNMLICGHSMGGLLTKLQIIDGGDELWHTFTDEPFEEMDLPPRTKELAHRLVYFDHLPFVTRVVFMAVPHRGSELATSWIGRFGASMVSLPGKFREQTNLAMNYLRDKMREGFEGEVNDEPITGIRDLRPDSFQSKVLGNWPLPERVPFHSIIGNQEQAGVAGGSDGVVPYTSAHQDGARSELIVKSGHNVQEHPLAIKELRRILHLHLDHYDQMGRDSAEGAE